MKKIILLLIIIAFAINCHAQFIKGVGLTRSQVIAQQAKDTTFFLLINKYHDTLQQKQLIYNRVNKDEYSTIEGFYDDVVTVCSYVHEMETNSFDAKYEDLTISKLKEIF